MSNRKHLCAARATLLELDADLARIARRVDDASARKNIGRARAMARGALDSLSAALARDLDAPGDDAIVAVIGPIAETVPPPPSPKPDAGDRSNAS